MTLRRGSMIAVITAVLIVSLAIVQAVVAASRNSGADVERLRSIELVKLGALVDADIVTLEMLLGEDFVLVPPPGTPLSKDEYLGALATGAIEYHDFHPVSPIEVRLYGQAAVLTYRSYIDIAVAGLGAFQTEVWHTFIYERRDGHWQVVREQATAVGGFPPR